MSEYLCKLCHAMAVHIVTKCIVTLVRYPHFVVCKAGLGVSGKYRVASE